MQADIFRDKLESNRANSKKVRLILDEVYLNAIDWHSRRLPIAASEGKERSGVILNFDDDSHLHMNVVQTDKGWIILESTMTWHGAFTEKV